jgi:hypothetical protein
MHRSACASPTIQEINRENLERELGFLDGQMQLGAETLRSLLPAPARRSLNELLKESREGRLEKGDPYLYYARTSSLRRILHVFTDANFALNIRHHQIEQSALHDLPYKVCDTMTFETKPSNADFEMVKVREKYFLEYRPETLREKIKRYGADTIPPLVLVFNGQVVCGNTKEEIEEILNKAEPGASFSFLDPWTGLATLAHGLELFLTFD